MDGQHARADLKVAATQVRVLQAEVTRGDRTAAAATLKSLQQHASAVRRRTHGPHWSAGRALPWLGPNIRAVQTVSEVIDDLAVKAMPALVSTTSLVDPKALAPVNGRVDLAPLVRAAPQIERADAQVQTDLRKLEAVSPSGLATPVSAPLADLTSRVGRLALTTATAARTVRLLPSMLGSAGVREYLLLVQDSAEPRATGGILSSVLLLRATNGAAKVVEQRSGRSLKLPAPALPLTTQEKSLLGDQFGTGMREVSLTPDFPRSGQLARAIWKKRTGGAVDGVLSVDQGTLADVLGATGPMTLPTGQRITAQNAVSLLLTTMHRQVTGPGRGEALYAATATSVFDAVLAGRGNPTRLVGSLARAARTGRFMVWSAHPQEQALLSGTVLSGDLVGVQGDSPVVGVFLNDGTAANTGSYLHTTVVARTTDCRADGSQAMSVRVTLRSTAPKNAANLPRHIAGDGTVVPAGELRTNVLLYPPRGGLVNSVRTHGGRPGAFTQSHHGLVVTGRTVHLRPGAQVVIDYEILGGRGQDGIPVLRVTPTIWGKNLIQSPSHC